MQYPELSTNWTELPVIIRFVSKIQNCSRTWSNPNLCLDK